MAKQQDDSYDIMANSRAGADIIAKKKALASTIANAKMISEMPKNDNWRYDVNYVETLISEVMNLCAQTGTLPTENLLASALGVARERVKEVRTGQIMAHEGVVKAINEFYKMSENVTLQAAVDGTANNITSIFVLKSVFGYQEQPKELVVTHNYNKLLGDRKDPEAIAQRYADAVVIDVPEEDIRDADDEEDTTDDIPDLNGLPEGISDPKKKSRKGK